MNINLEQTVMNKDDASKSWFEYAANEGEHLLIDRTSRKCAKPFLNLQNSKLTFSWLL